MADTCNKIETDQRGLLSDEMCSLTPSEMRQIVGGWSSTRRLEIQFVEINGCPQEAG